MGERPVPFVTSSLISRAVCLQQTTSETWSQLEKKEGSSSLLRSSPDRPETQIIAVKHHSEKKDPINCAETFLFTRVSPRRFNLPLTRLLSSRLHRRRPLAPPEIVEISQWCGRRALLPKHTTPWHRVGSSGRLASPLLPAARNSESIKKTCRRAGGATQLLDP